MRLLNRINSKALKRNVHTHNAITRKEEARIIRAG